MIMDSWRLKDCIDFDGNAFFKVIWAMLEAVSRDGSYLVNIPLTPEGIVPIMYSMYMIKG